MLRTILISLTFSAAASAGAAKPATNGSCPVLGNPVGNRNQSVVVGERNYYVCCSDCGGKLTADPNKYLDQDGK